MWSAFNAEKFKQFEDVAGLLRYLQTCVHSVIADHKRNNPIRTVDLEASDRLSTPNPPSIEAHVTDRIERRNLWLVAINLMRDEKECIVLKYSFMYDYKPAAIYAAFPDLFESLDEVYRIKRNLLNRLRRNPRLQQFFRQ
jgi:DNA-directed RNA polymerase specialized sigma24 family protein